MKSTILILACVLSAACGITKGGSPTAPDAAYDPSQSFAPFPVSDRSLRLLAGPAWSGTETADSGHGVNGEIRNVVFTSSGESGPVAATGVFVGQLETVNFSVSGSLDQMALIAVPGQSATGTRCAYGATGRRTEETERGGGMIEVISGRYDGHGPEPCPNKAGTFRLQRPLLPPPCMGGGSYPFAPGQFVAVFPPDFQNPFYPFALQPVPFTVPIGQWSFTAVTGDDHALKHDGPQAFEIVKFLFYGVTGNLLGSLGPTVDVGDDEDRHQSDIGSLTLTEAAVTMKVIHGYTGPPVTEPTHSVYPVSVTFTCPVR